MNCYLYFYWAKDGFEDARGDGPLDEDSKDFKAKETKVKKLFNKSQNYRGAIVAIDGFSRFAYTVPIKGNINSKEAKDALVDIIAMANRQYPAYKNKIRIIQSDKGSEFQGAFRDYLVDLNTDMSAMDEEELNEALKKYNLERDGTLAVKRRRLKDKFEGKTYHRDYFKHIYGYTGRSITQSLVERVNGTIKRMMLKVLGNNLERPWNNVLPKVTKIYNGNYHSTIKDRPENIAEYLEDEDLGKIEEIRKRLLERAKKKGVLATQRYKPGDYVRIKIFKPKKLGPKFSVKGGLADTLGKDEDDDLREELQGVYMIHSVRMGRSADEATEQNKPGRATTYRIVHNWSKESRLGTLPSGQAGARNKKQIKVLEGRYFRKGTKYPLVAFGRNFTANELSRVPQDEYGLPIVEEEDFLTNDEGKEKKKGKKRYVIKEILRRKKVNTDKNFRYEYEVKYEGKEFENDVYDVYYDDVAGTEALDRFFAKNDPRLR
eukprot:SAG31_NODE_1281_length_9019_cov_4.758072_6_plen_489_part_00